VLLKHPSKGYTRGRFYTVKNRGDFIGDVLLLQELVGRSYVTAFPTYGAPHPQFFLVLRDLAEPDPDDRNKGLTGLADQGKGFVAKGYRHRQDAERAMGKTPHVSSWRNRQGVWVRHGIGTRIGAVQKPVDKDDDQGGEE
jgi:hypothetical protein